MKLSKITLATVSLMGCGGPHSKEVGPITDLGRVVKTENAELVKIQLGDTSIFYIGDKATQSCVAQTERLGAWWGNRSVSITAVDPTACGFPPKVVKTEVVNIPPPPPKAPPTTVVVPKKTTPTPAPCPVCKTTPG